MHLERILRYPVKSLSVEELAATELTPGQGLPFDRRWALARPGGDAIGNTGWHRKSNFLVLVREHELARLKSRFDEPQQTLHITGPDGFEKGGDLRTPEGRNAIAHGVAEHLGLDESTTPQLVEAEDIAYFDTTEGPVSLLNMNSHRALEDALGHTLDPVRFRMNFLIESLDAWTEMNWPGKRLKIGGAVLEITQITGRCKATHVNPETGELDARVLHTLKHHFGHTQMGVYAKVVTGGMVKTGDPLQLES